MPTDVRMNYGSMENMAKAFHQSHDQLQETVGQMEKIAKMLEDGALLGVAGDALRDSVRSKLMKRLKILSAKMKEMEGDINGAVSATRDGVATAQSRFK